MTPYLEKSLLSEGTLIDIQMQVFPVEQWVQLFGILRGQVEARVVTGRCGVHEKHPVRQGGGATEFRGRQVSGSASGTSCGFPDTAETSDSGDGIASLNRAELTSLEELTVDTGDEGRPDVWKSFLGGNWNKLVVLLALEAAILAVHDQCI